RVVLMDGKREHLDAAVLLMPGRRRLEACAQIQRQPRRDLEVVLQEKRSVADHVVLVLARALVERADLTEQEVRKRVAGAGCGTAGKLEMTGPAELVADLDGVALQLAAELDAVLSLVPRHAVVDLDPGPEERRLEVVADVEEVDGVDLGDRR